MLSGIDGIILLYKIYDRYLILLINSIFTFTFSTLSDSYLEAFMLMAVEKTILKDIDVDKIIKKMKNNSSLHHKELTHTIVVS